MQEPRFGLISNPQIVYSTCLSLQTSIHNVCPTTKHLCDLKGLLNVRMLKVNIALFHLMESFALRTTESRHTVKGQSAYKGRLKQDFTSAQDRIENCVKADVMAFRVSVESGFTRIHIPAMNEKTTVIAER